MTTKAEINIVREWVNEQGKRCRTVLTKNFETEKILPPRMMVVHPSTGSWANADDDGDIFGASDDPELVELFQNKLNTQHYKIEPKGIDLLGRDGQPLMTDSPEGLGYIQEDHRDNVGRLTVMRSRALAIGDEWAATALAVAIQECIDRAKRMPKWTDTRAAAQPNNWAMNSDGKMECVIPFPEEELVNGEYPIDMIRQWLSERIIAAGCVEQAGNGDIQAADPLWWRDQGKKVDYRSWEVPSEDSMYAKFENLVHYATREAHEQWKAFETEFSMHEEELPLAQLLPSILVAKGIPFDADCTPEEYERLRMITGLNEYNNAIRSALARAADTESGLSHRIRNLDEAQANFVQKMNEGWASGAITLDDIVKIWVVSTVPFLGRHGDLKDRTNDAFRVVCYEGSPVLELLGIEQKPTCKFLSKQFKNKTRLEGTIDLALKAADPFSELQRLIENGKQHQVECSDENGPIAIHQCPYCLEALQTHLVRVMRTRKTSAEKQWLLNLKSGLDKDRE